MKKALQATQQEFESSCSHTPQYLAWHRLFKKEFTAFLKARGVTEIAIGKPNHFDMSGFFRDMTGQAWYFSLSDLRWFKDTMLLRTAKDFRDYTGGHNHAVSPRSPEDFEVGFCQVVTA